MLSNDGNPLFQPLTPTQHDDDGLVFYIPFNII